MIQAFNICDLEMSFRICYIEIVQMKDFLCVQILRTQQKCNKESENYKNKANLVKRYQAAYLQYIKDQRERVSEQIQAQQMQDKVRGQQILLQQSQSEFKFKLRAIQLQKFDLLSRCERNEGKFQKLRSINLQLIAKSKQIAGHKSNLKRKIAENQAISLKLGVQNQILRQRCQQQLQQACEKTIQNKNAILFQNVQEKLKENINFLQVIDITGRKIQEYHKNIKETTNIECKKKIIELQADLRRQLKANEAIRQQIEGQKYIETVFSMKQTVIQKILSFKQSILLNKDEARLKDQTVDLVNQNKLLKQKLSKFLQIQKEMEKVYESLSVNLQSYKYQDMKSLNKMNVKSSRLEKGLDYRRHFLKERQSIVDRYSKYLQ